QPTFAGWSMKYVAASEDVKRLLASFGHTRFDPYRFDDAQMAEMVALLQARPEATDARASRPASADQASTRIAHQALVVSVAALALALLAIVLALRS
ncbi:MAG: blue light sensor protein, partial [Xanthomonadaceae bacterium]|nr:blue light sensor protein [Xanthomonadaceae bacterium]